MSIRQRELAFDPASAAVAAWLFGARLLHGAERALARRQGKTMEQCKAEQAGKSKLADVPCRSCWPSSAS